MRITTKDFDDGCINLIITETDSTMRYEMSAWCRDFPDRVLMGKPQDEPCVLTFLKDDDLIEQFTKQFSKTSSRNGSDGRILKG